VLFHVSETGFAEVVREAQAAYRSSLPDERRVLFDRFRMEDIAIEAVGIGSVGALFCWAVFLGESPLAPTIQGSVSFGAGALWAEHIENNGRVVTGQRLMQSASDIFLGWTHGRGVTFLCAPTAGHENVGPNGRACRPILAVC
jgi:hypothetical protein